LPPPKLTFLSPELTAQIIAEAKMVLADLGVRVHNLEGLELLAEAGAAVDFQAQTARIPERITDQALASAPKEFFLYNLTGQPVVHYGGNQVHFDPGSAAVSILDAESGQQRPPTTDDLVKFIKLVEMLPQYDAQSTAFVCRDVAEGIGDLYRLYLALNFMSKPIITGAFGKQTWWVMWEMLCAVAGGEAALAEKPLAVFDVCPSPPLLWSDLTCQNMIDCARKRVPAQLVSMPLAGATAPVTLAGAIVQHAAESLSGIVIHQLAQPEAPIVWGGAPAAFDMRTGTTPMGDPATWLIDCGYIEVGKALSLPTHTYMGATDAKLLDAQSGLESAGGAILGALAGVNMISGAGMIDFLRCQSFEKLVIDAEIIGMAKRLARGIDAHEQPMAYELLRQVGFGAGFLATPHTQRWFRKELHLSSAVIDRSSLDGWQKNGAKSATDRAREQVDRLLVNYKLPPLSNALRQELRDITLRAARACGMDSLPDLSLDL
jgi:trimethylamine---corrinoid protein Co-methyltransferase